MITRTRALRPFLIAALLAPSLPQSAYAFCGFYVGKADATLFNEALQVIIGEVCDSRAR